MLPKNTFALSNMDDKHGELMLEGVKAKKFLYGFNGCEKCQGPSLTSCFHGEILKLDLI